MKYIIAALVAMLLLTSGAMALVGAGGFEVGATSGGTPNPDYPNASCPNCPAVFMGNNIVQVNNQSSTASQDGYSSQKSVNWAVVAGDNNYLFQTNIQSSLVADNGSVNENSTNLGLIVGTGNEAHQLNDPTSDLTQMNEVIVIGNYNYANQSNYAAADAGNATVYQSQHNFGLIFGNNSTLLQTNIAEAYNYGDPGAVINQTQANAAYLYGYENMVNQTNIHNATVDMNTTGSINQTAKNLAFAITSCCSPEFIPVCNNTSMEGECPAVPSTPPAAPAYPLSEYPLDP
jgi:hypothetical protein